MNYESGEVDSKDRLHCRGVFRTIKIIRVLYFECYIYEYLSSLILHLLQKRLFIQKFFLANMAYFKKTHTHTYTTKNPTIFNKYKLIMTSTARSVPVI